MSALIEHVKAWISKADHDLGSAKIIFLHLPNYSDTIAFHCQQATEKYIKAVLVFKEVTFERSHDLIYLLELLLHSRQANVRNKFNYCILSTFVLCFNLANFFP